MFGRRTTPGAGGGDLAARVAALEEAVQDNRALNVRLAELTELQDSITARRREAPGT